MAADAYTYIVMVYAIADTFLRIWLLMLLSILIALFLGILAARIKAAGAIIIPITNILQAVPVISFFPIILVFFIKRVGGQAGVDIASDFLIVTALLWNIILGVYEAIIHIPEEYFQVSRVYDISLFSRIKNLYLPASYPHIISNVMPSFSSGLFYITLSEVITIGTSNYQVFGVGSVAVNLAASDQFSQILLLIGILIIAIALNFYFVIDPLLKRAGKYRFDLQVPEQAGARKREPNVFLNAIRGRITQVATSGANAVFSLNRIVTNRESAPKRPRRLRMSDRSLNIIVGAILLTIFGVAVYFVATAGFGAAFLEYLTDISVLWQLTVAAGIDLLRIAIVFGVSFITMVPLAMYLGRRGSSGRLGTGIFQIIYSVPAPILFPLIVVYLTPKLSAFMGEGLAYNFNVLLVTFLSAAAYIFFNVFGSASSIPEDLNLVTRTFGIKGFRKIRYLTFPGIIPGLITGSMAAFGSYWGGLMVGEYTRIGGKTYSVGNGLMMLISKGIATDNLLFVDAIDLFMVFMIVIITYLLWMRLYRYSQRRFSV